MAAPEALARPSAPLKVWWARQDSNLQPDRYERPALTIELQAPPGRSRVLRIFSQLETSRLVTPVQRSGHPPHKSPSAGGIVQMAVLAGVFLCRLLFEGMLFLVEMRFRIGVRFGKARGGEAANIFDSPVLALFGLLLGFAFGRHHEGQRDFEHLPATGYARAR